MHQSLPSFALMLLFFTPAASSSARENNQLYIDCSPSLIKCGSAKTNISYPFWTEGRLDKCAYRKEFKISCNEEDNSFEIAIESRTYRIKEIDYENHKATIVDKDYYLGNAENPCLHPSSNISLDYRLLDYTEEDVKLTFLYDCPSPVQDDPNFKFLNCSSKHLSGGYSSAYFTHLLHITGPFVGCQVTEVHILERNRERLFANPEASWDDVLKEGFEVTWSTIDPGRRCWDCVQSNGNCGYNEASPAHPTCHCSGKLYPATCPHGKHLFSSVLLPPSSPSLCREEIAQLLYLLIIIKLLLLC